MEGNTADDNIGTKYFVEAVRRQIAEQYGEDVLYGGGLRIYTTLDFDMQRAAWDAVTSTLDQPTDPDAALVAVDEYGYVKAMVGGRDFEDDEVNLALGAAGGRLGPRRRLVVQAVRARRGDPPGHLAQLEVQRARVDHVRRRAGRQAGRGLEGRATTAAPSRACSTSSTPPACRPTPPTRS